VTAGFFATGGIAAVAKQKIAVVALFRAFQYAVATGTCFDFAISIAPIAENQIAIIAAFANVHKAVPAMARPTPSYQTLNGVATV
jgi:hypothetical protein